MAIPEWAGDHGSSRGDWVWTTKQRLSMLKAPTGITECAQRKNLRRKIEVPPKTRNRREHGLRQSGGKAESTLRGGRNRCQSRTTPAPMNEDQNRKGAPLMDTGTMNGASVSSFVPTPVFTARVSLPACLTRGAESRRAGSGRALGYGPGDLEQVGHLGVSEGPRRRAMTKISDQRLRRGVAESRKRRGTGKGK